MSVSKLTLCILYLAENGMLVSKVTDNITLASEGKPGTLLPVGYLKSMHETPLLMPCVCDNMAFLVIGCGWYHYAIIHVDIMYTGRVERICDDAMYPTAGWIMWCDGKTVRLLGKILSSLPGHGYYMASATELHEHLIASASVREESS